MGRGGGCACACCTGFSTCLGGLTFPCIGTASFGGFSTGLASGCVCVTPLLSFATILSDCSAFGIGMEALTSCAVTASPCLMPQSLAVLCDCMAKPQATMSATSSPWNPTERSTGFFHCSRSSNRLALTYAIVSNQQLVISN